MNSLSLQLQDLWLPFMFVVTVYLCKGCSQGWMSKRHCSGVPAWAQSPGAHLSFHISPRLICWRCLHMRAVHVKLPLETSMAADSRDCEGDAGFLYTLALTALLTCSPRTDQTQVRDSEQQDPGSLLLIEPNKPFRQKLQMVLITIFAHSSTSFFFLPFLFILHLSCGIFSYILWVWAPYLIYDLLFFCELSFHPADCWRDYHFPMLS